MSNDIPNIDLKVTSRKVEAKTRKLKSWLSLYYDDEWGIQVMYNNLLYSEDEIKNEVERDKRNGYYQKPLWIK